MSGKFLKISCRDCGAETIVFDRASTEISAQYADLLLLSPEVESRIFSGSTIVDVLE